MLHVADRGSGEVLVFIHAFPLDHTMWNGQAELFGSRYRVITPDLPGFGLSENIGPWTIPQIGEQLVALLDSLEIHHCTLIGLSIGGYIALPVAIAHPERIAKLVLAHTRARADNETERVTRNDMIALLRKEGASVLPERMLARLLAPQAPEEVRKQVKETIGRADTDAAIYAVEAMRDRADQTAKLGEVRCPTLVMAGDSDAIIKVDDCQRLAAAVPKGKLVVIPDAGHLSNLENPSAFNAALSEFLSPPGTGH